MLLVLTLLGLGWAGYRADRVLDARLPAVVAATTLHGQVVGLPRLFSDTLSFRFAPTHIDGREWTGGTVQARWYQPSVDLRPGQHWRLEVRLKPPVGRVNFSGTDIERVYFTQRISALATVREGERLGDSDSPFVLDRFRDELRRALATELSGVQGHGLVVALSVADRSYLDPGLRETLSVTGTGHLLAISGLHVGLVALFGFGLGRLLSWAWPNTWVRVPSASLHWFVGLSAATGYAALAGFGTSTRRALVMLAVWGLCRLSRREISPWRPWWLAMAAVFALDPLSPAQAGFWMSFGAVAVLVMVFSTRRPRPRGLSALLLAQTGIALIMLPLGMAWFGMAGGGGWLTNLLAIPWMSLVNLPLVLVGVGAWWLGLPYGEVLLYMAADASAWLETGLRFGATHLAFIAGDWPRPGWITLLLATLGGVALVAPRGLPARGLGMLLLLPLFLPPARGLSAGEWRLELLDVGQGLAAVVETRDHALVYDTGPGQAGAWDRVDSVLLPAFTARGLEPDMLLVSHGDLDHAGGLAGLMMHYPQLHALGNLPEMRRPSMAACMDERYWQWNGVRFDVMHPGRWLPYLGNDSSCVLSVSGDGASLLLPGDIGHRVERRLIDRSAGGFRVLVAPHHGSRHSTTTGFLDWTRPDIVLTATGFGNRFGFPHPDVTKRVEAAGARLLDTAACGAIRVKAGDDGRLVVTSARRDRAAPWRWQADEACP